MRFFTTNSSQYSLAVLRTGLLRLTISLGACGGGSGASNVGKQGDQARPTANASIT